MSAMPNITPFTTPVDDFKSLRSQLEKTQSAYIKVMMERNFLRRATAELNFHNNAHDGIIYTDESDKVIYANPYFMQMMKVSDADDVIGKPIPQYMWLAEEDFRQLRRDVEEFGFVRERALNLYNRDKEPIFVACSSVASKSDDGKFIGMEIMLCNVTTKQKLQQQLTDQSGKLETTMQTLRDQVAELKQLVEIKADQTSLETVIAKLETTLVK